MSAVGYICLGNTLLWLLIAWHTEKKHGAFHLYTIFSLLFTLTYPIKLFLTEIGYAVVNSSDIGPKYQLYGLAFSNLSALIILLTAASISGKPIKARINAEIPTLNPWDIKKLAILLLLLCLGTWGIPSLNPELLSESTEARYANRVGRAGSALLTEAIFTVTTLVACYAANPKNQTGNRLASFAILATSSAWGLLATGSKYIALVPFVAIAIWRDHNWPMKKSRAAGVTIAFLALLVAFAQIRSWTTPEGNVVYAGFIQTSNAFDAPDNLALILSRTQNLSIGDMNFTPTIDYLVVAPIPRFIWPDKPLVVGNLAIMERYLPERYNGHDGEVVSPSMAGEMILSGGVPFLIVWSSIIGLVIGLIVRSVSSQTHNSISFNSIIYIWLSLNIFNLFRSGTGILGSLLVFAFVAFITVTLARHLCTEKAR